MLPVRVWSPWRRAVVVLAAMALVAGACGSRSGDDAVPEGPTSEESPAGAERAEEARVRIRYRAALPGTGESEFVFSQDPPRRAYIGGEAVVISDAEADTVISCVTTGEPRCELLRDVQEQAFGAAAPPMASALFSFQEFAETGFGGTEATRDDEIAGRAAVCTTVGGGEAGGEGGTDIYVDRDTGVLLRVSVQSGEGATTIEALEFAEPRPADFEPPTEPVEETPPDT